MLEGCIFKYDSESPKKEWEAWTKVKQVPPKSVVATFNGNWRKKIEWKKAGSTVSIDCIGDNVVLTYTFAS